MTDPEQQEELCHKCGNRIRGSVFQFNSTRWCGSCFESNLMRAENERLKSVIRRAETRFFVDGSDTTTACAMLKILHEAKIND